MLEYLGLTPPNSKLSMTTQASTLSVLSSAEISNSSITLYQDKLKKGSATQLQNWIKSPSVKTTDKSSSQMPNRGSELATMSPVVSILSFPVNLCYLLICLFADIHCSKFNSQTCRYLQGKSLL